VTGLFDRFTDKGFGIALDLLQQEAREFLRGELALAQTHLLAAVHEAFERGGGTLRIEIACRRAGSPTMI
jgi:hypothetical protein